MKSTVDKIVDKVIKSVRPNADTSHTCYQKPDKRVRMLWPAAWGTYIRAEHGKIGGES